MMTFHSVKRLPEFEKDLKKLKKKYKSLEDDLDMFIKAQLTNFIINRGLTMVE